MLMPKVVPLFATPLVVYDVPDSAPLNVELRRVVEQREKSHPTTWKSNMGGWQSSWDMDRWGGVSAIKLLAYARNVANQMTTDQQGVVGQVPYLGHFAVTWLGNMWANINRSGTPPTSTTPIPAPTGRARTTSTMAESTPTTRFGQ